jgi:uncharacterized phiE125 gp8 family phage protein
MNHTLITAPTGEPVTVEEARSHCRIDGNQDDEMLFALTKAAREYAEAYTGRSFVSTTWELRVDQFPLYFELPKGPLASVTSITYIDIAGNTQTLSANSYQVVNDSGPFAQPGMIFQAYNQTWPSSRGHINDVRIRYVAGYGTPSDVPPAIKAAIKLMTAHLYENREATLTGTVVSEFPLGFTALLSPFKVF